MSHSIMLTISDVFPYIKSVLFEVEDIVYEALYDPVRLGFWETKAYCDDLGGGWQLPTPTNYAEVSCRVFLSVESIIAIFRTRQLQK